ncbi:2-amino-4-hydroxy-6-hydroxymethyldihydropteridine diphosphokinase [Gilvimarinus polysaccharolyticus]|uniref:2-amino-4-hydroxy-6- hydroxymethyldihydropteridine diphosphokinase n=1 Tax=Gilvimarinus polysaccharolyticus TaxID=863921 RepID=UPI00067339EC|nr:2-amino-4-hydroxy-6-hydroxymethyldihydropteridine diphosphokinase [Gilvimarinus polysaccharolyticus]
MKPVYLSLGSNIERYRHITAALEALADEFGGLDVSTVYESESVGFEGSHFLNLVVGVYSGLNITELSARLKQIEDDNDRNRDGPKFSPRTLDIDILLYGDFVGTTAGIELPRDEINKNAFVLQPLAELAPELKHPQLGKTYAELWHAYDKTRQKLWPVDFNWRDMALPCSY